MVPIKPKTILNNSCLPKNIARIFIETISKAKVEAKDIWKVSFFNIYGIIHRKGGVISTTTIDR